VDGPGSSRASVGTESSREDGAEALRIIEWTHLPLRALARSEADASDPDASDPDASDPAAAYLAVDQDPDQDQDQDQETGLPAGRVKLSVRFENRVSLNDSVRGQLEVAFKGALSGLQSVAIYHPVGGLRTDRAAARVRTRVLADFELSLAGIRYQDVRGVPDRKRESDRSKPETDEFAGVVPDHETVIDLTNAMSDQGYYVKRLIENPPRSGGRANVVNRYWDIAGRRYDGVYPVDFHVILTGAEVYRGDIRAQAGNTNVRITVQGAYASPAMEERIVQEWERLRDLTVETLRLRPRAAEPIDQPDHVGAYTPDGEQPIGNGAGRAATLRKRLDDLADALLDGRISEDTYREIKERAERELGEF
jgi:hypothetical protein